jgi:hypothetical protein
VVGRPDARLEPCVESVGRDELIVRIVGAASMTHSAEIDITGEDGDAHFTPPTVALGYSLIDIARGTGTLATIFADRVDRLSRALDVDRGTLFGRTVAHEIGHLLLGRQNHSELGLMRGTWTRHTLIENHREDWSFTREEASDMRLALQARSASATARRD